MPEHDIFIRGELAKLEVLEPHDYESFKAFYDQKREEYKRKLVEEQTGGSVETDVSENVPVVETTEETSETPTESKLTEEEFRALPASKQKELVKHKVTGAGQDTNTEKRVSLYFS